MKNNIEQTGFQTFYDYQNSNSHSRLGNHYHRKRAMDNTFASSSFSSSSQLSSQVCYVYAVTFLGLSKHISDFLKLLNFLAAASSKL